MEPKLLDRHGKVGDTRAEKAYFFGLFVGGELATGGAKLPPPLDGAENGALVVLGAGAGVVAGA
jgi:hypothetical protein